jgi:hypothetical protein
VYFTSEGLTLAFVGRAERTVRCSAEESSSADADEKCAGP